MGDDGIVGAKIEVSIQRSAPRTFWAEDARQEKYEI
jgi:hypothetical protein